MAINFLNNSSYNNIFANSILFRCHSCWNKSKRLSRFYELDLNIQGHSSLNQCIKEFLKVRYNISNCNMLCFVLVSSCICLLDLIDNSSSKRKKKFATVKEVWIPGLN